MCILKQKITTIFLFGNFMKATTLQFLHSLSKNNNRDWFHTHKEKYEEARLDVEQLVEFLIPAIRDFDPRIANLTAKQCMFRIYRDIRFSKDKTPYKTYFGSYMAPGGRKSPLCGYYLHLEPGNYLLAGGSYHPAGEYLKLIRSEIYYHLDEFLQIIEEPDFKDTFGELVGDRLKRPPKGFPADFPGIEYLKMKDFTIFYRLEEQQILSPGFAAYLLEIFGKMKPLNDFFNRALEA